MLEESVSNHGHERVAVEALPGSPLEVVETQFFFQLLVSLLANPSRLDGGRQGAQVRLCRQVGEIVFLLPRQPVFADEPGLVPWQMLLTLVPDPLRWSILGLTKLRAGPHRRRWHSVHAPGPSQAPFQNPSWGQEPLKAFELMTEH